MAKNDYTTRITYPVPPEQLRARGRTGQQPQPPETQGLDSAGNPPPVDEGRQPDPVVGYTPYFVPADASNLLGGSSGSGDAGGGGGLIPAGSALQVNRGTAQNYTTRQVQNEELTSYQLNQLLDQDGAYIRNARSRAAELANRRGAFSSSLMAGAAQRAAIEAGVEIAREDAQAYRQAASENLQAANNFALQMIQRETSIDTTRISADAQLRSTQMSAQARLAAARIQQSTALQTAEISARANVEVANLNAQIRLRLQEMNDAAAMARLIESGEQTLETQVILKELEQANLERTAEITAYTNLNNLYMQQMTTILSSGLKKKKLQAQLNRLDQWFQAQWSLLNKRFGNSGQASTPPAIGIGG